MWVRIPPWPITPNPLRNSLFRKGFALFLCTLPIASVYQLDPVNPTWTPLSAKRALSGSVLVQLRTGLGEVVEITSGVGVGGEDRRAVTHKPLGIDQSDPRVT